MFLEMQTVILQIFFSSFSELSVKLFEFSKARYFLIIFIYSRTYSVTVE